MYAWWYYNIIEPWTFPWMLRAVSVSALTAVACGLLGCWLYVRRLSMIGDALSHVVVPGLAIAFMITGHRDPTAMLIGATIAGLLATTLISLFERHIRIKEDASIGIVYTSMFALGVILIAKVARRVHLDADCVLFGNILGVEDSSLWLMAVICAVVIALTTLFFRPLMISSFDPSFAVAVGLPVAFIHYTLMALLSVTTVASFEAVGAILVVALLIAPAATAHLLTDKMPTMLLIATIHSVLSAVLGIYAAIWIDAAPAGAMVLVGAGFYAMAFAWRQLQRSRHRRRAITRAQAQLA